MTPNDETPIVGGLRDLARMDLLIVAIVLLSQGTLVYMVHSENKRAEDRHSQIMQGLSPSNMNNSNSVNIHRPRSLDEMVAEQLANDRAQKLKDKTDDM